MCARIMRHPLVRPSVAEYLGQFVADMSASGFVKGTQWLIWKFESDSTLGDALNGALGPFPECIADLFVRNGAALP